MIGEKVELSAAMRKLYDAEIDHGLRSWWDAGWQVWLRAPDGRDWFHTFRDEDLADIGPWLLERAAALYPDRFAS